MAGPGTVEPAPRGADKGTRAAAAAELLGIGAERTVADGGMPNDPPIRAGSGRRTPGIPLAALRRPTGTIRSLV
ncbi:HAD family hydrolase [Streptomyces aureocirculatus]|uniref:hypothetical protein n=1 Tax=Streptomyces aureocirculatus TaxID=67275 RepID=UPI0004CBB0B1